MEEQLTLGRLEELAAARLEPLWLEYFRGGCGDEQTLRENVDAFRRARLVPRVLAGIERTSAATTVLGLELSLPLLVAPVAYQRMAHPDAEPGMARACAAAGAGFCLSTLATTAPGELAAAAPGVSWLFQLYVLDDPGLADDLVDEALDAGCAGVVLTVDAVVLGSRDRERRASWQLPVGEVPALRRLGERGAPAGALMRPSLDWSDVERLAARLPVPLVVKGILAAEDAVLAADHGAAGVVVSNHGGRQLDGVLPTLEALPGVVEAAGDRLEVLVDGGVRRGRDVVVALALGARAVLAGRAPLYGLAAGGEAGAALVLELLREEVEVALHLAGCRTPADVTRALVRT